MDEPADAPKHQEEDAQGRLLSLLGALVRIGSTLGAALSGGAARLLAAQRLEVRKLASIVALSLAAAFFACAAAGFAAYSVLIALGEEHRVLGSALIAGCFALMSGIAILLARSRSGPS